MRSVEFEGSTVCPGKVVCVGKNYVAHIEEMNSPVPEQMVVFLKPNTAIGDRLRAFAGEPLHYEGEICLLMRDDVIAGIGFGLDLTKRATQAKLKAAGLPWERSKAFDGAAVFSQFVPAPASLANVVLELWVDGELRQRGGVELMMYRPATILDELHTFMTLDDNDIVMTGTPAGVGEIKPGEHFEGRLLDGDRGAGECGVDC
jgi:2-keto-4-pentenoate hydratase/2-oxohepta-3-ene-1,7-dioic acid hydratase in catechol pathway